MTFNQQYWIRRRAYFKGRLTYHTNEIDNLVDEPSISTLESILQRIADVNSKFEDAQSKLEQEAPADDDMQQREQFDNDYGALEKRILLMVETLRQKATPVIKQTVRPKLPDISVPKFDGNHLHWLAYRDCFQELVGKSDLDSVTKYRYLETSLIGSKAHDVIRSIPSSDFETAWTRLADEYDNTILIIDMHVKALYDVDAMKKDSADSLQKFLDTVEGNLAALRSLDVPVDSWDLLLVHHLSQRMDLSSRKELEKLKSPDEQFTYTEFKDFLKNRIRLLHAISDVSISSNPLATSTPNSTRLRKDFKIKTLLTSTNKERPLSCYICSENHVISNCPQIHEKTHDEIMQLITQKGLCFNCLRSSHSVDNCSSPYRCRVCKEKHHTVLHDHSNQTSNSPENTTNISIENPTVSLHVATSAVVLLATAVVLVKDRTGKFIPCRAVLDNCSTSCFMTEETVQKLGIKKQLSWTKVNGVNDVETSNKYQTTTIVKSRLSNFEIDLDFLVSKKIVGDLPVAKVDVTQWSLPPLEQLADPNFNVPEKIDLLLGAEVFFAILTGERKQIDVNMWLYSTDFGYIIGGKNSNSSSEKSHAYCSIENLRDQIQRFWEVESLDHVQNFTIEEKAAENNYSETVTRQLDGRYSVALPLNSNIHSLGQSKQKTKMLFLYAESRLQRNAVKYQQYRQFMQEMIDLKHMEKAPEDSVIQNYIVHHMVSRPTSTTTKYRVVFNASYKTSSGYSLNDMLHVGPTIQDDVFTHLCNWRKYPVALISDVEKMYRQILIHEHHRDYQRVWWRDSPNSELNSYRLNTVTYGTASAPYQAIRTLKQLALDECQLFPNAAHLISHNFYVDDFVSSFSSKSEALTIKKELIELMHKGCFSLHKWNSNVKLLDEERKNDTVSVLGVKWNKKSDSIIMSFDEITFHPQVSKATILSEIAQLYDPLGLCSPIVLVAKIFMQELWSEIDITWSNDLPDNLIQKWLEFRELLKGMLPIEIPRCLINISESRTEIHGFADASDKAYGACIYIRVMTLNEVSTSLICAKTRVAPLKRMTMPRLELCAALLLSQLVKKTREIFDIPQVNSYLWSDSEITLYRVKSESTKYNSFVGTRLAQIQEYTSPSNWNYVPSRINPADIASRGVMPDQLCNLELWWHGPEFIRHVDLPWPEQKNFECDEDKKEIRKIVQTLIVSPIFDDEFILKQSSYDKLLSIMSYVLRFIQNARLAKDQRILTSLNPNDRRKALIRIVRLVQDNEFLNEKRQLQKNGSVENSSNLKKLNPFIDKEGLVRVGGRLQNSKLSWDNQHQLIIPKNHHLALLIIRQIHFRNMHCGPQALLNTVRQNFWVIGGRSMCKKVVHDCVICFRRRPIMLKQLMGQLPESRVVPARAFQKVGIDYCGPFQIKYQVRTKVTTKAYVALWTCFVTRATHLEVVHDLTTDSFLAAFRRFISRRGIPSEIYTDNATNFTGAQRELQELKSAYLHQEHIQKVLSFCFNQDISWKFIPPRSPHFGAIYESMIKQAKYHLKRVTNELVFTTEQLDTIICQIECCLNSRPLTPLSDDIDDYKALTPGHFLIGQPLNALPEPVLLQYNINRLSLWQKVQQSIQQFWIRWSKDYLNELQQRSKWFQSSDNIKCGQLVLMHDDNLPPTQWLLGRISETHPGSDKKIRVVTIKTKNGLFRRAIAKIAPLPID